MDRKQLEAVYARLKADVPDRNKSSWDTIMKNHLDIPMLLEYIDTLMAENAEMLLKRLKGPVT